MLILFDQSTPVPIRTFLKGHKVQTAWQLGWDKLKNGELLKAAEDAGFDVFVTPDKNIRHQQNLKIHFNRDRCSGQSTVAGAAPPH
jgi:hypothetical protein